MKFFSILPVVGTLVLGALNVVAQDAGTITQGIRDITDASNDLRVVVEDITLANAPVQAIKIAPGLEKIAEECTHLIKSVVVPNPVPFDNNVALDIVEVLTDFVHVHQALLNAIIGKHGIIAKFPFIGPPIAVALQALEKVVDELAFGIIGLIPTQQDAALPLIMELDKTFQEAIDTYT